MATDINACTPLNSTNPKNRSSLRNTNDELVDSFASLHENKLPVNLFHSAASYNKMLITNGRSVKKVHDDDDLSGFIDNLEYINEPIFYLGQQRRKQTKNNKMKPVNAFTLHCSCAQTHSCPSCLASNGGSNKLFQN